MNRTHRRTVWRHDARANGADFLQTVLLALFVIAYYYPALRHKDVR